MRSHVFVPLLALVLAPVVVHAQNAQEKAAADVLFHEGRDLMKKGNNADACPKFEAAFKLDPKPGTRLNLADCYDKVGRTASAWALFREAANLARKANETEREDFAAGRAAALESKLSRLVVKLSPGADPPGLEIKHDGQALSRALLGTPVPVDPGPHVIEANAPGKSSWSSKVEIESGARVTVEVPVLGEPTRYPEPARTTTVKPSSSSPEPRATPTAAPVVDQPPSPGRTQRYIGIGVGAAGIAMIAVGIGVGASAKSKYNDSFDNHCDAEGMCDQEGYDGVQSAKSTAMVATIVTGVGIAAVGAGVVLYLIAPKGESTKTALRVAPGVGPGVVTLNAAGSF